MIQILATLPPGGETQTPLAASSKDAASASFVALFAEALMQGAVTAMADKPVQGASPGHSRRLPELSVEDLAQEIGLAAVPAEAETAAVATSITPAAAPAVLTAASESAVSDASGATTAAGSMVEPETADAIAVADQLLMAMRVPPEPANAPTGKAAESPSTAAADVASEPGGRGRSGKKLPNPTAVLAVQQKALAAIQKNNEASPAISAAGPFSAAAAEQANLVAVGDTRTSAPAEVAAGKEMAAPVLPTTPGQEVALASVRAHAVPGWQGKAVLGMQNAFGSAAWHQELGDKLIWLSGRQGQTAELILNPPSLGAVEVRLNMNGSEASAQFFAANPQVRDALEAALPRLRELMGSAGIALGEAMVSDQSFGHRDKAESGHAGGSGGQGLTGALEEGGTLERTRITGTRLLDYFA